MDQLPHPEKLNKSPSPIFDFHFSSAVAKEAKTENKQLLGKYNAKLDKYFQEVVVGEGYPIIEMILRVTRNKEDLKKISSTLSRVADIVEIVDLLEKRRNCLDLAETDPDWFALAFGDHGDSVEYALERLIEEETEETIVENEQS